MHYLFEILDVDLLTRYPADITGVGVRVSFYVQAILTSMSLSSVSLSKFLRCRSVIVAYLPDTDADTSYWSMTATAFALFISALVLYGKGQLPLYLGISVSILLYMHSHSAFSILSWSYDPGALRNRVEDMSVDIERIHFLERRRQRVRMYPVRIIAGTFCGPRL